MASEHAKHFAALEDVEVVACADLDAERAKEFADTHAIPKWYDSFEAAVADGGFDAVANATPDAAHFPTTMMALEAGFHVFCEKPLATNHADALTMLNTAEKLGRVHGVNLTYRNVAALQVAKDMVRAGRIGTLRHVEASYRQSWLTQPAWGDWKTESAWLWRLSTAHGSQGVLGDVGIHILDFATFAAGEAIVRVSGDVVTFDKAPGNQIGSYPLDANDNFTATCRFAGGATGTVYASRFATGHLNDLSLRLYGDQGGIAVTNEGDLGTLSICEGDAKESADWTAVPIEPVATNYARFADAVNTGVSMEPDFRVATELQAVIDGIFASSINERPWRADDA